jgi:hypothetical protein
VAATELGCQPRTAQTAQPRELANSEGITRIPMGKKNRGDRCLETRVQIIESSGVIIVMLIFCVLWS